jgi:hypothetical protein
VNNLHHLLLTIYSTKVFSLMKLRSVAIALPVILAAVLIAGCQPQIELLSEQYLQDTSLVTGDPCSAPCWRNITPGETAWTDALARVQDDPTLAEVNEQTSEESSEVAITFQNRDGIPCCLLYSTDGEVVDQILLQVAPDMTTGQVIDVLGEPTYVAGTDSENAQGLSPEQASLALYFPEAQTVVYSFVEGRENGALSEQSPIFAVLYVRADDMEEVIAGSALYLWDGYKPYAEYIDGNYDVTPEPTSEAGATEDIVGEAATAEATDDSDETEAASANDEETEVTEEVTEETTDEAGN